MHSLYIGVREVRASLIREVASTARSAATSPDLAMDQTDQRALTALNEMLANYMGLVQILATPGHEHYSERNLPEEEKTDLASARHFLKILNMLHDPQPAPSYDPGRNLTPAPTETPA